MSKQRSSTETRTEGRPPLGFFYAPPPEETITLLDLGVAIARHRRLILVCMLGALVLGLVAAMNAPRRYVAEAKLVLSVSKEGNEALSLLRSFGLSMGESSIITPNVYPEIVQSPDFLLALARDTFYVGHLRQRMTLRDYYWRRQLRQKSWGYYLSLWNWMGGAKAAAQTPQATEIVALGPEEHALVQLLRQTLTVSVKGGEDDQRGEASIISVRATTDDPYLSAGIVEQAIDHLQDAIKRIKTEKARENLKFLEWKFAQVEAELRQAENELARFLDANRNPQTAQLRAEMERLQRQVSFKEQLYREVQLQKTLAEIQVQKDAPVLSVVQPPVSPYGPSGRSRKQILLLSLILGLMVGLGLTLVSYLISYSASEEERRRKLEEVRALLNPRIWWRDLLELVQTVRHRVARLIDT